MGNDAESGLVRLVESEAKRLQWEESIGADPARTAAGWTRRFVVDARRCDEMLRVYRELGFDVVADPVVSDSVAGECNDCRLLALEQFRMIYARPGAD